MTYQLVRNDKFIKASHAVRFIVNIALMSRILDSYIALQFKTQTSRKYVTLYA